MRVVVIGATGHIGSYLVPRLVAAGHEVIAISRGTRRPYRSHPSWNAVEQISADRESEDLEGTFGRRIADLGCDTVIDLLCFNTDSAQLMVDALRGTGSYLLHCGTIWVHGAAVEIPVTEDSLRRPFGEYGVAKAAIEELLLAQSRRGGVATTVLHPGHIVGPGWRPVNPAGNFTLEPFSALAGGEELALPNFGLETLHHVHADDVAQAFMLALDHPSAAINEAFHVVSERAITLRGYAEAVASWFGQKARITYVPWDEWGKTVSDADAVDSFNHITHSPSISIEKAQRLLRYAPRYSSLEAIYEALSWLVSNGEVKIGGQLLAGPPALPAG